MTERASVGFARGWLNGVVGLYHAVVSSDVNGSANSAPDPSYGPRDEPVEHVAVMVVRQDGQWEATRLPDSLADDLDGLLDEIEAQVSSAVAIVLINVQDEFFVALRLGSGGRPLVLLSDVTAAVEYPLAEDVLELLDEPSPDADTEIWPAGDLGMFTDLGLAELELGAILADLDLYADEMLLAVAHRLGYASQWRSAIG